MTVALADIVFRFKRPDPHLWYRCLRHVATPKLSALRWGRQADTCYVVCPTSEAVDRCVQEIQAAFRHCCVLLYALRADTKQELAVPKRVAHGSLFGIDLKRGRS